MTLTQFRNVLLLATVLSLCATGCTRNKGMVTPLPNGGPGGTAGNPNETPGGTMKPQGDGVSELPGLHSTSAGHPGWTENAETFKADTVHFDFDSSSLKPSEKPKVEAVAAALKSNTANAVKVEGHCDERGTEEYNRSLGERRALAIREELITLGIDPNRVDTISYGEDKPAATGHDEAAWKQNRRAEFIELTPPKP